MERHQLPWLRPLLAGGGPLAWAERRQDGVARRSRRRCAAISRRPSAPSSSTTAVRSESRTIVSAGRAAL